MQRLSFLLFGTFAFFCVTVISNAQIYPIQSQVALVPPYSGNLSDYIFPGSQRITVSLTCNDITISNYRVKFRLTIEGLGITIRSRPNLSLEPFIIDGGSPLILSGDDLAQYFDPRNLDFVGYSRTEYQRSGKLPEGVYRFSIEVLDFNRGTVVSNKGFATAWIMWNDVPILNLPANNSKARIIDPTNIPFTWTPRHTGSPNSAFTTEYVFRLIEIWPSNRNPNDAFLSQTPLYEVETTQSQIVYGPGEPLLIPGRKYAWQVQARDQEGRDLFRNNGKSEVFVFQFGDVLEMPQNVRKETANATTISIRWETSPTGEIPERFRIRYRPEGGSIWYEDVTTQYWHTLTGLRNNKAYDIQVRAEAGRQVSDYTFNQRHSTTLPIVDENFQCGNPFNIQPPAMTTPLQHMNPGDIFKVADFDVYVTEVVKSPTTPGAFSGKGYAKVYLMNRANIEGIFSGTFNSEFQMVTGNFKTIYESGSKMAHLTEAMKKIGEKPPVIDSAVVNPESTLITITGIIDSVYINTDGKIVVLTEDGGTQTFEQKKNAQGEKQEMIVKDLAGNTWTVDKDGNISKAEAAIAGVFTSRDSLNFTVNFKENTSDQYGFDKDSKFPTPETTKINNTDYSMGWKSVEQGKQDFVDAFIQGINRFPKKVGFKIEAQPVSLQPGTEPNSSKVILPGAFDGDKQELVAYAKLKEPGSTTESEIILGKLNVATYEYISKKVIIVPVNSASPPSGAQVQSRLNKIYGQAVAGWQVTIAQEFKVDSNFLTKLDEDESANFASYNSKMREFNRQYKNSTPSYDRSAFYIFLIKGTDFRFDAFMPFKRGFGYVFVDKVTDPILTIAHELGHGAFNLRHTFDEYPSVSRKSTDNLMDYNGGEVLKKYQWDNVHNQESMVGWLQDDEGAALTTSGDNKLSAFVCDSLVQSGKVYYQISDSCKLHVTLERKDTTITQVAVKLVALISGTKTKMEKSYTITSFGEKQHLAVDSLPDGKYEITATFGTTTLKQNFFYRKTQCDYACNVCGRNLTVTHARLKKVFSDAVTSQEAELFNVALKTAGFNTCKKQLQVFSQIRVETINFTKFIEILNYRPSVFLSTFPNNCNLKSFYNQNFWTNKNYKKYFSYKVYEFDTVSTGTKYKGESEIKYIWNPNTNAATQEAYCIGVVKQAGDTIRIPTNFVSPTNNEIGQYKSVSYTDAQKIETQKRLMSLTYANRMGNGDSTTHDGYNFRGRGAVHLTGREAYQKVTQKANSLFSTNFNWETNYQDLETNKQAIIYSGIAFFVWKLNNNLEYLQNNNCTSVSRKVNGGDNGLPERKAAFNLLLDRDLFDCTISKE